MEPTNSKLETDATSTTAGTPPISSYITSKLCFALLFSNSTSCIRTLYIVCRCYKVCFFPSHTTITFQQVLSLPPQTTQSTQQSSPYIQQAYITLYITGSFHTLHLVHFEFIHTSTNLSIGGSMAQPSTTLTLFVLDQTQHSWSQSTQTLTHSRTSISACIQPKSTT